MSCIHDMMTANYGVLFGCVQQVTIMVTSWGVPCKTIDNSPVFWCYSSVFAGCFKGYPYKNTTNSPGFCGYFKVHPYKINCLTFLL